MQEDMRRRFGEVDLLAVGLRMNRHPEAGSMNPCWMSSVACDFSADVRLQALP